MDLDPADAKLLALADNRAAELADWDDEGLAAILRDLEAEEVDLSGIGWDLDDLADMLQPAEYAAAADSELDLSDFDDFEHKCPRCNFEWSNQ
jgi:ParB-like chromosome segregation protein Spo0J